MSVTQWRWLSLDSDEHNRHHHLYYSRGILVLSLASQGKPQKRLREYFVLNCREQTAKLTSPLATYCKMFYRAVAGHFRDAYWLHLLPPDSQELTTMEYEMESELDRAKNREQCISKGDRDSVTINRNDYGPLATARTPSPYWRALSAEEPKRLMEYR